MTTDRALKLAQAALHEERRRVGSAEYGEAADTIQRLRDSLLRPPGVSLRVWRLLNPRT